MLRSIRSSNKFHQTPFRVQYRISKGGQRISEWNKNAWVSSVRNGLEHLAWHSHPSVSRPGRVFVQHGFWRRGWAVNLAVMGRKVCLFLLTLESHQNRDLFQPWRHNNWSIGQQSWLCSLHLFRKPTSIKSALRNLICGRVVLVQQPPFPQWKIPSLHISSSIRKVVGTWQESDRKCLE